MAAPARGNGRFVRLRLGARLMGEIQRRFLALHKYHFVERWQQIFRGSMVRAFAERGLIVTIRADELNELVEMNLIEPRNGTLLLTEQGKAAA